MTTYSYYPATFTNLDTPVGQSFFMSAYSSNRSDGIIWFCPPKDYVIRGVDILVDDRVISNWEGTIKFDFWINSVNVFSKSFADTDVILFNNGNNHDGTNNPQGVLKISSNEFSSSESALSPVCIFCDTSQVSGVANGNITTIVHAYFLVEV